MAETLNLEETDMQIAHIQKNLLNLIQLTQVNVSLTSHLVSKGLFSSDDVDALDAIPAKNERAKVFYTIKTKANFYPHLIAALEAGKQSGAIAILRSL